MVLHDKLAYYICRLHCLGQMIKQMVNKTLPLTYNHLILFCSVCCLFVFFFHTVGSEKEGASLASHSSIQCLLCCIEFYYRQQISFFSLLLLPVHQFDMVSISDLFWFVCLFDFYFFFLYDLGCNIVNQLMSETRNTELFLTITSL